MTLSLIAVEEVLRKIAGGISRYLVEGEREVVNTPRIQMNVHKMAGDDIGGSVHSAGPSSIKIPVGADYGDCAVVLVRDVSLSSCFPFVIEDSLFEHKQETMQCSCP